jgi:16S rRNA G966 N2-methylase RsmD
MRMPHKIKKLAENLSSLTSPIINNKLIISSALASKAREQMLRSEEILTLNDILEVGSIFYGGRDLLSLYGMDPFSFNKKGIRLLGRTSIECAIDAQSIQIARFIKNLKDDFFHGKGVVLLDLFAGSGNSLYHITKKINPLESIGIESNEKIYNLTCENLRIVNSNSKLYFGDAFEVIKQLKFPKETPIFVFLDPPWGRGLSSKYGLDLMKTSPSVYKTIIDVQKTLPHNPLIFIIKTYEKMAHYSVVNIVDQFSYSSIKLIPVMDNRFNIGMMVCTNEESKASYFSSYLAA